MEDVRFEPWVQAVQQQRASRGRPMQPRCPETEIARLRVASRERLGVEPPQRYLDLLRITNGWDENGMQLYASQESRNTASDILGGEYIVPGFVEQNEQYRSDREGYDQLLIFAQSELYVYALELEPNKYIVLGQGDQEASEVYGTFDELMIAAFRRILKPEFLPRESERR